MSYNRVTSQLTIRSWDKRDREREKAGVTMSRYKDNRQPIGYTFIITTTTANKRQTGHAIKVCHCDGDCMSNSRRILNSNTFLRLSATQSDCGQVEWLRDYKPKGLQRLSGESGGRLSNIYYIYHDYAGKIETSGSMVILCKILTIFVKLSSQT